MDLTKTLCGLVMLLAAGCTPLGLQTLSMASFGLPSSKADKAEKSKGDKDDEDEDGEFSTKVNTPLIGEYTQVGGLNVIVLQGVGLVTGLRGTGGDPPPSMYRTAMLEDMRKRNIKDPNKILRDPNTALVVVRAYLPPLVEKGEHFDVEVRAVDGSGVQSLNGGWLMETELTEQALVPGRGVMKGHTYARAQGPVLVSTGGGAVKEGSALLQRGRIVGGGTSLKDRDLTLFLRNDFRSVRNSDRIAKRIGERFFEYNESGQRKPLAEAKTDQRIQLKLQSKYKDNFPRYLQVIRNITYRETQVALQVRMHDLKDKLLTPQTAEEAAIKLEAIGEAAVPILKAGLQSPSLEVQFHSAVALAYIGKPDGLQVLAKAVRDEPAFRVFGLAAMAVVDDAESYMLLKELLNEESAETRYGAFRAMTTLDENHPDLRGEKVGDDFRLHVLNTTGPPLVHLTNRRKAEVVLFGADQCFRVPLVAYAGLHILVTAQPGSDTITVSRHEDGKVRTVSTKIADVVRAVVELGATYPDVADLLAQSGAMQNLPGRIEIDALPKAGRVYIRPEKEVAGKTKSQTNVGNVNLVPNLFSSYDDSEGTSEKESSSHKSDGKETGSNSSTRSDAPAKDKTESKPDAEPVKSKMNEAPENHKDSDLPAGSKASNKSDERKPNAAASMKGVSANQFENDDENVAEGALMKRSWSWNPFRMFGGMDQSEPDIDTEPSPASSSFEKKLMGSQSKP